MLAIFLMFSRFLTYFHKVKGFSRPLTNIVKFPAFLGFPGLLGTMKVATLYFNIALIMLVIDGLLALIIHPLIIVYDNTTDAHHDTSYESQINIYLLRSHINVNSVLLCSTFSCDFVELIIQPQPISFYIKCPSS